MKVCNWITLGGIGAVAFAVFTMASPNQVWAMKNCGGANQPPCPVTSCPKGQAMFTDNSGNDVCGYAKCPAGTVQTGTTDYGSLICGPAPTPTPTPTPTWSPITIYLPPPPTIPTGCAADPVCNNKNNNLNSRRNALNQIANRNRGNASSSGPNTGPQTSPPPPPRSTLGN
jgi:hypothetical protein